MMMTMMVITMVRAPVLTNDVQTWARHPLVDCPTR